MSAIATGTVDETARGPNPAAPRARRRGIVFWVTRYLPAEIVGTATMVVAGLGVTAWTDAPAAIAFAAVAGEAVGFYAVLAVTIYLEQRTGPSPRRRAAARTGMLLVAEFGVAELLDTFLIRPAALVAGVLVFADPMWGLLAGKVVADLAFYAIAAGAFTVTARIGLRSGSGQPVATGAGDPRRDSRR
ncbi:UNVERIFIED_CONTAM: DUF2613 family protein [Microbacterium sp. SLM126]